MGFTFSPLRYPGGKSRLRRLAKDLVIRNGLVGGQYLEPFAGGAGVAWALLLGNQVHHVHINDIDPALYAFWSAVLERTDEFCDRLRNVPISITEWERQKVIYANPEGEDPLELGFATFFLNRTNRSGIIGGGPIGGRKQSGTFRIDARFNRLELERRIRRLASLRSKISVYRQDAIDFIREQLRTDGRRSLLFADPPYFSRGDDLYANSYAESDHQALADLLIGLNNRLWILSYDDHPKVREFYRTQRQISYELSYSAQSRYKGRELLILSDPLVFNDSCLPAKYQFEWVN